MYAVQPPPRYPFDTAEQAEWAARLLRRARFGLVAIVFYAILPLMNTLMMSTNSGWLLGVNILLWWALLFLLVTWLQGWLTPFPPAGSPLEDYRRAFCIGAVRVGWAAAVAAGVTALLGVGGVFVALVGWPRATDGTVDPSVVGAVTSALTGAAGAALFARYALRRLTNPHLALSRQLARPTQLVGPFPGSGSSPANDDPGRKT